MYIFHYTNFKIKIINLLKFNMCITTHFYCFFNHENILWSHRKFNESAASFLTVVDI